MRDYLASVQLDRVKDILQYGVPGMRWGQRRSSSQLRSAAAQRAASAPSGGSSKPPSGGAETPATRYARLKVQAESGGASQLDDADLKFFNARTEALNKINKMNQANPSWLSATSKTVLQKAAEQQMQTIANAIANKYVGGPITDSIGKYVDKETAKKAAEAAAEAAKQAKS